MVRLDIQHDLPARAVKRFDDAPVAHQDGIQELRSHRGEERVSGDFVHSRLEIGLQQ